MGIIKTAKMMRLLGKTLLLIALILASACRMDKHNAHGRLVKMDGKYYRLECRMGNVYALELIVMDTVVVVK